MTIDWHPTALRQYEEVISYWIIRNYSTTYSDKLDRLVMAEEFRLLSNPYLGRPTIYGDIRTILVDGKYNIYYEYDEELDEIHILSFWDGRQNPEKLTELLI